MITKEGQEAAKTLGDLYGLERVLYRRLDVSSPNNFLDALDFCVDNFGSVDIIVNNAGINGENNWESMLDVNLKGVVNGTNLGIKYMGKTGRMNPDGTRKGGVVVNVSSVQVIP